MIQEQLKNRRYAISIAFSSTYLNNRKIHDKERILYSGPVKIQCRVLASKGKVLLKDRFAVLCPSRLLLFRNGWEIKKPEQGLALAVYPIVRSEFSLHDAPPMTE